MHEDPPFLSHLGKFATLKNAIAGHFYQGALDGGATVEEIFAAIWRDHDPASRRLLSDQLNEVLAGPESELALIWREWSGYMFSNHADTRAFFELFKNAVEGPGHGA